MPSFGLNLQSSSPQKPSASLENLVLKFKANGNVAFLEVANHFRKMRSNWFRHAQRFLKMDHDTFNSEFDTILYTSLRNYKPDPLSKFDHYLTSAIAKRISGLKRNMMSLKGKAERKGVSLCPKRHDVEDKRPVYEQQMMQLEDLVDRHVTEEIDKQIVSMKIAGASVSDICDEMRIEKSRYWKSIHQLRKKARFVSDFIVC